MYPTQLHSYLLWRSGVEPSPQSLASKRYTAAVSLIPATMCGCFVYGWYAALVILSSLFGALLADQVCRRFIYKRDQEFFLKRDGVWLLTGLLLGLMLPPAMPMWLAALGSFIAVFVGKYFLQVDGTQLLQPTLLGLLSLHIICPLVVLVNLAAPSATMNPGDRWPVLDRASSLETTTEDKGKFMPKFLRNFFGGDIRNSIDRKKFSEELFSSKAITAEAKHGPRPLDIVAAQPSRDLSCCREGPPDAAVVESFDVWRMLIGYLPGTIGASGGLGLIAGILLLVFSRAFSPIIPVVGLSTLLAGLYAMAWLGGGQSGASVVYGNIPIHLLNGATLLAAFYLASDPAVAPRSVKGRLYAGLLFGICELLFRLVFKMPDGLLISVLAVQASSFAIDQWLAPPNASAPSSIHFGLTPSSLGRL